MRPLFIWFGGIVAIAPSIDKLEIVYKWALSKRTVILSFIYIFFSDRILNSTKILRGL